MSGSLAASDATPRRVLVTGARGRLGRSLAAVLAADPPASWAPSWAARSWSGAAERPAGDILEIDLADAAAIEPGIAAVRPAVIVHLGAYLPHAGGDAALAHRVNVEATRILADAAARHGVERIVFASSAAVYGDSRPRALREDDDLGPASVYGETKADAEAALADSGVPTMLLRIFNVHGDRFSDSLVTRLRSATPDAPVRLHGWSRFVRDYVHGDDVARALVRAAEVPGVTGAVPLNIASGEPLSNEALVARLERDGPVPHVRDGDAESWSWADTSAAERALGVTASRL
ncbi:MAG: NAD-dependent epimerase/dehydratase family protein [Microbacteriaceae bacterium]